jgi:hypothetical protein
MTKKMTDWFPAHIKPVHAGVYEVFTPNSRVNKYAYYDNHGWRLCSSYVGEAENEKPWISDIPYSSMTLRGAKWRGFTEPQQ